MCSTYAVQMQYSRCSTLTSILLSSGDSPMPTMRIDSGSDDADTRVSIVSYSRGSGRWFAWVEFKARKHSSDRRKGGAL